MDFQIDGVKVDNVQHNGVDINEVQIDGVTVWLASTQWLIEVNPTNTVEIGFGANSEGVTQFGGLQPKELPTSPPTNCQKLFTLTTIEQLFIYADDLSTSPDTILVTIEGFGQVTCNRTTAYAWASTLDPTLLAFIQANIGNSIAVEFAALGLETHNVYANKETGGYNRATATAAGYMWSDGSNIYYGWQESTSSGTGDVLPIPAPNVSTSIVLLAGVDETLYEFALVSAPFTITSRTPVDTTTAGIGTWYDMPSAGIPTLFAQCHGTENSSSSSATAAGYLTSVWHIRLKGTTDVLMQVSSEIKVRAKSTL